MKIKVLISIMVTLKLIMAFVFAYCKRQIFKLNKKEEERNTLFLKTNILWSFKLDCMYREARWPSGGASDTNSKIFPS